MPYIRFALVFVVCVATLPSFSAGQGANSAPRPAVDNAFIQRAFGSTCTINSSVPPLTADLNGDGVEDIVIAAQCKDPMMDADEHRYTVIDPYYSFYGFGNPKITTQYATSDPQVRSLAVLIVHGAGPEAWWSATPQAKFLIVNLAYKNINVKRYALKKKTVTGIYFEEAGGDQVTSVVFWDGKKYRYTPIGSSLE
jgi:hypothetical protein